MASKRLDNAHPFGMQLTAAKTYIASGQTSMHTVAIAEKGLEQRAVEEEEDDSDDDDEED